MLLSFGLASSACTAPDPGEGRAGEEAAELLPGWPDPSATRPTDTGQQDSTPPTVTEEDVGAWASPVFSTTEVMQIEVTLSAEAVAALRADPDTYVEGSISSGGHTWAPVGLRLKGSSSFQPIDQKCNWKIKLDDYTDERFYGQKRLTLNNNIWDSSAMAQDLAYRFFQMAGAPAPSTGFAWVTLNGEPKGLYTILETMDGQFADREWPGSEGNLYETTYSVGCDFTGDGSCYDLKSEGEGEPDPDHALATATAAVATGTYEAVRAAFDWDRLMAFLAVERVINHPDSYSYNLNNHFVYHDPVEDKVSLIPWGADSTFVYTYPPDIDDYPCAASAYRDVLSSGAAGWLARFCQADASCWADLSAEMARVADLLAEVDLAGAAEANRERLRPYVEADPLVMYSPEDFERRVDCFVEWITDRPDEIHAWLGF